MLFHSISESVDKHVIYFSKEIHFYSELLFCYLHYIVANWPGLTISFCLSVFVFVSLTSSDISKTFVWH